MNAQKPSEAAPTFKVCTEAEFSANVRKIVDAADPLLITRHGRFVAAYIPEHMKELQELLEARLEANKSAGDSQTDTEKGDE